MLDRIIYTITQMLHCIHVNSPEYTRGISLFFISLNHTRVYSPHRKVTGFAIDGRTEAYDEWRALSHPPPPRTMVLHWKSRTMSPLPPPTTTVQSAVCLAWQSEFEYVVLYVLRINVISCTEAIKVESMEFKYSFCFIYVASLHRFHTHTRSTTQLCSSRQQHYWCRQEERQQHRAGQMNPKINSKQIDIYSRRATVEVVYAMAQFGIIKYSLNSTSFTSRRLHACTAATSSRREEKKTHTNF